MADGISTEPAAPPRPAVGDELELRIESLAFGGDGVARTAAGYVVFVAGGFPGDLVRARVHDRKRSYAHARAPERERLDAQHELVADRGSGAGQGSSHSSSAFCAWRRFSAWSQIRWRGPYSTSPVISSPMCAGRSCRAIASGRARSSRASSTR